MYLFQTSRLFFLNLCSVDENRKAKSTPAILAEIVKEEGL